MQAVILLVRLILRLFEILLVLRAITSWFPIASSNLFIQFLYFCTEPLVAPVRSLLFRIPSLRTFPLDLSFIVVFVIIQLLSSII